VQGIPHSENPVWSGMDVVRIALLMFITPFFLITLVALLAQQLVYRGASWSNIAQKPVVALLAEFLAYIAVVFYMVVLVEGKYHVRFADAISWNWPAQSWPKFLGAGVGLMIALQFVAHFLPIPKNVPFDQFFQRPLEAWLTSIFAISFGPLMEEFFFRGFLYPVLARRTGMGMAIFLTALGFGALHALQYAFAWGLVLIIFLVGVVLTAVRAKTGSVGASFLVHVGYNATLMVLTFLGTDGFRHMERLNR
jgi:membrane protease YdiL (CAAX protease family)